MLMIVVDEVPHESIWREWAGKVDMDAEDYHSDSAAPAVRFLIHAKEPDAISSQWVRCRLAKTFHLKSSWGSLELTDVMIRLLREAFKADDSLGVFCFCSDSCIPVTSLKEFQHAILASPSLSDNSESREGVYCSSWIDYNYEPTNGYAKQKQFDVLQGRVPSQCIAKADQWLLLTRTHVQQILELSDAQTFSVRPLLQSFRGVSASDEIFFPACLSVLGILPCKDNASNTTNRSQRQDEVRRQRLTYCEWRAGDPSPRTFTDLTQADIARARAQGCLLFRKLKSPHSSSSQRFGAAQYSREALEQCRLRRADSVVLEQEAKWRTDMLSKWLALVGNRITDEIDDSDSQVCKRHKQT